MDDRIEIIVGAQDNTAIPLEKLKSKLDELGRKVAEARVEVTDKDAAAKLAAMRVRLDSMGRRVVSPRLSLQGAAKVEAGLLAVDAAFDRLDGKTAEMNVKVEKTGNLFTRMAASILPGLARMAANVGSAVTGMASGLATSAAESGPAAAGYAALAVSLAAVGVALTPIIASLSLVAVGFAGLAAVAVPEIGKVWKAVSKGKDAIDKLSGPERSVARQIEGMKSAFHRLAESVRPEVLAAFGDSLRIVHRLMPALTPLIRAAGKAIDGFLGRIDGWLASASGRRFIHWMGTEGPAAIKRFTNDLWAALNVLGHVFTWMFSEGGKLIHAFGNVVHAGGNMIHAFGNVVHAGGNVIHAMGNVAHAVGNVANAIGNVIGFIENAVGAFGRLASAADSALGGIPGKILGFLGLASGGIAGAAAGRISSGLTLVGEHGPELLALPPSTRVHSAPDTQRMLAGGARPAVVNINLRLGGRGGGMLGVEQALLSWIRKTVHNEGGGDVQVAFGWSQ